MSAPTRLRPEPISEPVTEATSVGTAAATWRAWGVEIRLVVTDASTLTLARRRLTDELAAVDAAVSRFRPDAEIHRLDASSGRPVPASRLLREYVAAGLRGARLTGGLVDPTLADALTAAGYDRDIDLVRRHAGTVRPGGARITDGDRTTAHDARPARRAWTRIRIDDAAGTIAVPAGVRLDLGATAKALTADRAARAIAAATGGGVLVGIGGDIAMAGPAPVGGWRIRVQDAAPGVVVAETAGTRITAGISEGALGVGGGAHRGALPAAGRTAADAGPVAPAVHDTGGRGAATEVVPATAAPTDDVVVRLTGGGLATSSTALRAWVRAGEALHHIVDPRTGVPAVSPWRTVSVAAASCLEANIASTGAVVLGAAAADWLGGHGLPARLVDHDGQVWRVAGWPVETDTACPAGTGVAPAVAHG